MKRKVVVWLGLVVGMWFVVWGWDLVVGVGGWGWWLGLGLRLHCDWIEIGILLKWGIDFISILFFVRFCFFRNRLLVILIVLLSGWIARDVKIRTS